MKRAGWVTGATVAQVLLGLLLCGTSLFLLSLIRSPEIKQGDSAAQAILGIKIAAGLIAPLGLLVLAGAYGLWKDKLWGWWLALLADLGLFSVFVYSLIDDGWNSMEWDTVVFTILPLVPIVFLLLPPVRRFYWRSGPSQVLPAAIERSKT
jgi:uncharacterized membrane protein (DUF2068 family)